MRAFLDGDAALIGLGCPRGCTPLHHAVLGGSQPVVDLLLDRGANIHTRSTRDSQAIDVAIWGGGRSSIDLRLARLLVSRGATCDLTVASALGDLAGIRQMLDADPSRIGETRPSGRRPLSAAVQFGHDDVARLLLERGANPRWEEPDAPRGTSLHWASRLGNLGMVRLLLDHGADPNEDIDSTASPTAFAATPEIRALLESRGGDLDSYDTTRLERDDAAILLDAGATITARDEEYRSTPLAWAARANRPGMVEFLLSRGAPVSLPDDESWATPLAWAERRGYQEIASMLRSQGATR